MKRWFSAAVVVASVVFPLAAVAQPAPSTPLGTGGPPAGGPPPEARAKLEKIRADARLAATNALGPDHRTTVGGIVDQVNARTLEPRSAAAKIDALLTSDEKTRLAAIEQKFRTEMRAALGGAPPPGGPPPGGPPQGGGGFRDRAPDPGRFLMMLSRERRFHGPEPRASGAP